MLRHLQGLSDFSQPQISFGQKPVGFGQPVPIMPCFGNQCFQIACGGGKLSHPDASATQITQKYVGIFVTFDLTGNDQSFFILSDCRGKITLKVRTFAHIV